MPAVINYRFSQTFSVSAEEAYLWCTDFTPDDPGLMAEENATRAINRLSNVTIILKETFYGAKEAVVKEKLVQFYPDRLIWISTHLSGPNKYSQFIYEIVAETSTSSRLEFTARHIDYKTAISQLEIAVLKDSLCKYDSDIWKLLAKAMEKELQI